MEQLAPLALPVKTVPQALPARLARRGLLVRLALPESLPIRLQLTAASWEMKKRGLRLW